MDQSYGQKEKLKAKKEIEQLFSEGKSLNKFPIRLIYKKTSVENDPKIKAAVSVSKRNFKKAVDRNYIKRLLREGFRKNKTLITTKTSDSFSFIFLYTDKKKPNSLLIESKIKDLLQKFIKKEL